MDNSEQITRGQKTAIAVLGGITLLLLISNIAVVATMEPLPPVQVKAPDAKKPDHVYVIPAPEPADESIQETPASSPQEQEFERILKEGVAAFDGSMGGYKKGVRYIQSRIISNPDFEGTEYVDRARTFLKKHEDKLNEKIEAIFSEISTKVEKLRAEQRWHEAESALRKFPLEYCSISIWGTQFNELKTGISSDAKGWLKNVLEEADGKLAAGDTEGALEYLSQKKHEMSGKLPSSTQTSLANKIEKIGMKLRAVDQTKAMDEEIDLSLYKKEGEKNIEFWLDFEKLPGPLRKGIVVTEHAYPGSAKCVKADYNPDLRYNQEEVGLSCSFTSSRNRVISFWYYLEKPSTYLTITAWHPDSRTPFFDKISSPKTGCWTFCHIPTMALSGSWAKPPIDHQPGASFSSLQFTVGIKGSPQLGLYLNNIALSDGTPLYMFPEAENDSGFLENIHLDYSKDFCSMNLTALANLLPFLGEEVNRGKAVIAGGTHLTADLFSGTIKAHPEISFLKTEKTLSLQDIEYGLDRFISSDKPAFAAVFPCYSGAGKDIPEMEVSAGLRKIAMLCITNGCIPVLITAPPEKESDQRQVEHFNDIIKQTGYTMNIPVIDMYTCLSRPRGVDLSTYISPEGTFTQKGQERIDPVFNKFFTIISTYILKRK